MYILYVSDAKNDFLGQKVKIIHFLTKITSDTYKTYVSDESVCVLCIFKFL